MAHRFRTGAAALVLLALSAGPLAGCGSGSDTQPATAPAPEFSSPAPAPATTSAPAPATSAAPNGSTVMIHISKYMFSTLLPVNPGATIAVMDMDAEAHTVTADKGKAFDVTTPPGKVVTFTAPTTPGRYPFHCDYHSQMHGVLVVK